MINTTIFLITK